MRTICEFPESIAVSLSDVVSQPDVGDIELLVLATVAPAGSETTALARRLGKPTETVRAAVVRLAQAGLVEATGDSVTLTRTGRLAAANVRKSRPTAGEGTPATTIDLSEVSRFIGSLWPVDTQRAAAEQAARAELLASDADRETVVQLLSEAFSQGRLTSDELEHRTATALAARTYGELDDVLHGLGGLQRPGRSHPCVRPSSGWSPCSPRRSCWSARCSSLSEATQVTTSAESSSSSCCFPGCSRSGGGPGREAEPGSRSSHDGLDAGRGPGPAPSGSTGGCDRRTRRAARRGRRADRPWAPHPRWRLRR